MKRACIYLSEIDLEFHPDPTPKKQLNWDCVAEFSSTFPRTETSAVCNAGIGASYLRRCIQYYYCELLVTSSVLIATVSWLCYVIVQADFLVVASVDTNLCLEQRFLKSGGLDCIGMF